LYPGGTDAPPSPPLQDIPFLLCCEDMSCSFFFASFFMQGRPHPTRITPIPSQAALPFKRLVFSPPPNVGTISSFFFPVKHLVYPLPILPQKDKSPLLRIFFILSIFPMLMKPFAVLSDLPPSFHLIQFCSYSPSQNSFEVFPPMKMAISSGLPRLVPLLRGNRPFLAKLLFSSLLFGSSFRHEDRDTSLSSRWRPFFSSIAGVQANPSLEVFLTPFFPRWIYSKELLPCTRIVPSAPPSCQEYPPFRLLSSNRDAE